MNCIRMIGRTWKVTPAARICFWLDGFETAFAEASVDRLAGKVPDPRHILLEPGDFSRVYLA